MTRPAAMSADPLSPSPGSGAVTPTAPHLTSFASPSTRNTDTPVIPFRQTSLRSSPPQSSRPRGSTSSTTSVSPGTARAHNIELTPSATDQGPSAPVGFAMASTVRSLSTRVARERRLKDQGSWDEEKELEEVLMEVGAGFGLDTLGISPPRPPRKDKLLNVLGLPLPPTTRPSDPSPAHSASSPSTTTTTTPTAHSSSLPSLPRNSLSRRPSSPNQPTQSLPPQPVRRPSLPAPASTQPIKGPSVPSTLADKPQGFGHGRRTSLSLGFGINLHLGGSSSSSSTALGSPTGTASSPTAPLHLPRLTFTNSNNSNSHPPSSSSAPSIASSTRAGQAAALPASMSTFSFGQSLSSASAQPKSPLAGSVSSSALREQSMTGGLAPNASAKVGKSESKMNLAGFLGRRRNEGEGHGMARSISSSGADGTSANGHGPKSPSMFPLQSLLKQTFTASSSSSLSQTTPPLPPARSPRQPSTPDLPLLPAHPHPTAPADVAPVPVAPTTRLLATALRLERQLSPNPSALALAAADPSHEHFSADLIRTKRPAFPPYAPRVADPPARAPTKADALEDHAWIEEWIRTGVGRPGEEMARRAREDRRRLPLWKADANLPQDPSRSGTGNTNASHGGQQKLNSKASLSSSSRSSSSSSSEATTVAGGRGGESSGEESNGTLLTPLTSSPVIDKAPVGLGLGMRAGLTSRRKVGAAADGDGWQEAEQADAGVRINLVPASPSA